MTLITQFWLGLDQHFLLPGMGRMARRTLPVVGNGRVDHFVVRVEGVCRIIVTLEAQLHTSLSEQSGSLSHMGIVAIDAGIIIGNGRMDHGSLELVVTTVAKGSPLGPEQELSR